MPDKDYVAISAQLHEHACYLTGSDPRDFYTNAATLVHTQIEINARYKIDAPEVFFDMYNIEVEALGAELVFFGVSAPQIASRPLIRGKTDIENLKLDLGPRHCPGRTRFVIEVNRLIERELGRPPVLYFCAPFSLAVQLRGYANFISDLKHRPKFARDLLQALCHKVIAPWIRHQYAFSPEATIALGVDAWGSLPNSDLRIWDEFIIPTYHFLVDSLEGEIAVGQAGYWGESLVPTPREFAARKLAVIGPGFNGCVFGLDPDVARLGSEWFAYTANHFQRGLVLGIGSDLLYEGSPRAIALKIGQSIRSAREKKVPVTIFLTQVRWDTPAAHIHAAVDAVRRSALRDLVKKRS